MSNKRTISYCKSCSDYTNHVNKHICTFIIGKATQASIGTTHKKGLFQEDLAYVADIPMSQIRRIESGEINTTIGTINTLAKALDIHPKVLLDFDV